MMDMKLTLTHKGWWMFCPVYLNLDDEPLVVPRWFWLLPVYWLAGITQQSVITLCSFLYEDYVPQWYFLVTGEIK